MIFRALFPRKAYDIPDSWAVCTLSGDRAGALRINTPLKDFPHKADFPLSTIFAVPLSSFDKNSDITFAFEDALFEHLQDAGWGIVAAVVTSSDTRDFIAYMKDPAAGQKVAHALRRQFPNVQVELSYEQDLAWGLFDTLLPSVEP